MLRRFILAIAITLTSPTQSFSTEPYDARPFASTDGNRAASSDSEHGFVNLLSALAVLTLLGCLSVGCTMGNSRSSWIEPLDKVDAAPLATAMAAFVQAKLSPTGPAIIIESSQDHEVGLSLQSVLETRLRRDGFAIGDATNPPKDAHYLRYLITLEGRTVLMRLTISNDNKIIIEANTVFVRAEDGRLVAAAPFSVRER